MTKPLTARAAETLAYFAKMTREGFKPTHEGQSFRTVEALVNRGLLERTAPAATWFDGALNEAPVRYSCTDRGFAALEA